MKNIIEQSDPRLSNEKLEDLLVKSVFENEITGNIIKIIKEAGYALDLSIKEQENNAEYEIIPEQKKININISNNTEVLTKNPIIDNKKNISTKDILMYRLAHELAHILDFLKEKNPKLQDGIEKIKKIAKEKRQSENKGLSLVGNINCYKKISKETFDDKNEIPATEDMAEILATRLIFPKEFEEYKKLLSEGNKEIASLSEENINELSHSIERIIKEVSPSPLQPIEEEKKSISENIQNIIEENPKKEESVLPPTPDAPVSNQKIESQEISAENEFEKESQKITEKLKNRITKMKDRLSFWGQKYGEKTTETKEVIRGQIKAIKKEMKELELPRKVRGSAWLITKEFLFPPWNIFKLGNPLKWKKVLLKLRKKWEDYAKEEARRIGERFD